MILDCENIDNCINSLTKILNLPSIVIFKTLCEIDIEEMISSGTIVGDPDRFLLNFFKEEYGVNTEYTSSYWFHNSRVKKGTDFKNGILPLNLIIEEITPFIDSLAETIDTSGVITKMTNSSNGCHHYLTKRGEREHWGPYAFLVRETAIRRDAFSHDYLKIPEIVRDYIDCEYQQISQQLLEKYLSKTVSCIVKFRVNKNQEYLLGKALYYLYLTLRGQELSLNSNTCHDNKAKVISAEYISKIEYLFDY